MSSYQDPDLQQRQRDAAAAKKATLEKFRAASDDPAVAMRHATRVAMNEARSVRIAEREAAKRAREAELAEQATVLLNSPCKPNAKQRKSRRSQRPKRQNVRRWRRPSKKWPGMLDTQPAKLQKRNAGGVTDSAPPCAMASRKDARRFYRARRQRPGLSNSGLSLAI